MSRNTPHLCECGCLQPTRLAPYTDPGKGWIRGRPLRFINRHHYRLMRRPIAERFWSNVRRADKDECWEWTAARDCHGYGRIGRGGMDEGWVGAHRVSWELHHGPVPDGLYVLHQCDNPPCVNPHHLYLGTLADNSQDMMRKQRGRGQFSKREAA